MATKRVHLKSQEEAMILFGQNDQVLRDLEKRYRVQFFVRPSTLPSGEGLTLAIRGKPQAIDKALVALESRRQSPPQPTGLKTFDVPSAEGGNKDMIIRSATGASIT